MRLDSYSFGRNASTLKFLPHNESHFNEFSYFGGKVRKGFHHFSWVAPFVLRIQNNLHYLLFMIIFAPVSPTLLPSLPDNQVFALCIRDVLLSSLMKLKLSRCMCSFDYLFVWFLGFVTRNKTQDLMLARRVLCHLAMSLALYAVFEGESRMYPLLIVSQYS